MSTPPARTEPPAEHGHYLLYVFGAVCLVLGSRQAMGAQREGAWDGDGLIALGLGVAAVLVGALLHDRDQRRRPSPPKADTGHPRAWLQMGLSLLLFPLVGAWIQFEAFADPIQMFPYATVLGGVITAYALARLLLPQGRGRRVLGPTLAASVGAPGALLLHALLVGHFTHHLSNVAVWTMPGEQFSGDRPLLVGADLPQREAELELPSAQLELLAGLDAKPVEPGEYWIDEDGTIRRLGDDEPIEVLSGDDLDAMFEAAQREDEEAAKEGRAAAQAAHRQKVEALRRGGRIFR